MSATTVRAPAGSTERVVYSKLWWAGPLAIVAALVANLAATALFQALLRPDPAFMPLTFGAVIFFTTMGVLGATIVYAALGRFSSRPVSLFRRVALIVLVVSFIPDLLLPFQPQAFPGVTWPNAIALMVLHAIAWAVCVPLLTRFAGEE